MITVPDPDARNTERYRTNLAFRAAADKAHARAMQFCKTLQLLKQPLLDEWIPEDIDWQNERLTHAIGSEVFDY